MWSWSDPKNKLSSDFSGRYEITVHNINGQECSLAASVSFVFLDQKRWVLKRCLTLRPASAWRQQKVWPDLTPSPAPRGGGHTHKRSVRGEKRAQGEEFQFSCREGCQGTSAAKEMWTGESGVCLRREVCEGVNKVRRAVARTTTNPELGPEPSRCPTHPSFALSRLFFLHPSIGQP